MARSEKTDFDRMVDYRARHTGWVVFISTYWAIYLVALGFVLMYYSAIGVSLSAQYFTGFALVLLGIMFIIMGCVSSLHNKLMKKYVGS